MTKIYNRRDMLSRRRRLRRHATAQEKTLYQALRRRQVAGARFRFNPSIGFYVPDFYCPEHRLVVELDGSQHSTAEGKGNDSERTAFLESLGIRVLRFSNRQVDDELEEVIREIREAVEAAKAEPPLPGTFAKAAVPRPPSLHKEGGKPTY